MSIPVYVELPSQRSEHDKATPSLAKTLNHAACRALDLVLATFFLILLSPLFLLISLLIIWDSQGSVFFAQDRVGRHGRTFRCFKFRSMCADAEQKKQQLLHANEASGPLFKIRQDPRITRIGSWLRRYSLDELPQLFNIVRGEMSLVGPRPALPTEVATYGDYQQRRLAAVPGLTGLAQVSGRADLDFDRSVDLDLEYIDHCSVWLNIVIMFRTIPAIISTRGAY